MQHLPTYGDERVLAFCAFCGGQTGTRDHCPSRVLLDEPFPANLPVVPACSICNARFSADEEYFACLVSCAIAGSTDPLEMPRSKTQRLLASKPALRARIERSRRTEDGSSVFAPEHERVAAVVKKLARGHALYELHEPCTKEPAKLRYLPLALIPEEQRHDFESPEWSGVWPEVGSRALQRLVEGRDLTPSGWIEVQPERYRYCAQLIEGIDIRIVIHEYLACHVRWEY